MHGYDDEAHVQIFYKIVYNATKGNLDAVASGALWSKGSDVAKQIIEEMVTQSNQWFNDKSNSKRVVDMFEINTWSVILEKLNQVANQMPATKI